MARALARRTAPPFLRLRSTVGDDSYWMGRLDHKDWLAPNEVLKIFANIRDASLITSVFRKACARRDYKPNETLYSLMIDRLACARRFGDVEELLARARVEKFRFSDEFFYRLIKMYGNVANHPEKAMETLYTMPGYNCWPSTKTFNYVLHMLVCKRQYEVVHEVYKSAPTLGVTLDTCCFNILIKGLCQFGKFDEAISLLHEMPKQECLPNVVTYSTLMHFLCQHGRVDKAFELFERMRKEEIDADTVVYNILVSGLCREGKVTIAFDMFKSMSSEGCYPNSGTYQVLLDGLLTSRNFVEAKDLVSMMSAEGLRPSFSSYKLLIDGLCSVNCLEDGHLVLKQMVDQGFVPRMGTWTKLLTSMGLTYTGGFVDNLIHLNRELILNIGSWNDQNLQMLKPSEAATIICDMVTNLCIPIKSKRRSTIIPLNGNLLDKGWHWSVQRSSWMLAFTDHECFNCRSSGMQRPRAIGKNPGLFANCVGDRVGKSSESLGKTQIRAKISPILSHMQELSRNFSYFEIVFVNREANRAAH